MFVSKAKFYHVFALRSIKLQIYTTPEEIEEIFNLGCWKFYHAKLKTDFLRFSSMLCVVLASSFSSPGWGLAVVELMK